MISSALQPQSDSVDLCVKEGWADANQKHEIHFHRVVLLLLLLLLLVLPILLLSPLFSFFLLFVNHFLLGLLLFRVFLLAFRIFNGLMSLLSHWCARERGAI